jgi:hypothetical protein
LSGVGMLSLRSDCGLSAGRADFKNVLSIGGSRIGTTK